MTIQPKIEAIEDVVLEQSVLGAMMMRSGMIDKVAGELEARHFSDPLHQRIFDTMVYLQSEGDVTPTILASVMRVDAASATVNVRDYVHDMANAAPIVASNSEIKLWTEELKDLALRRRLYGIGGDLAELALQNPDGLDAENMSEQFIDELLDAGNDAREEQLSPYEIGLETIRELEDAKAGRITPVIKTGIDPLDGEVGGLRGGDLITILGKSGMGKSALMCRLALMLSSADVAVIFFSLEMKRRQLIERIVCDIDFDGYPGAPMAYSQIRNHRVTDEEFKRFVLANQHLQGLPLEIVDDDGLNMTQITARARAFKAKHKGKRMAVIGDYLQIVEPYDARENRERQVNRIARGAKSGAKRLDCPWIWGSQMNEADAARAQGERRPRSSDARESRGIMNESDLMLAPWRPLVGIEDRKPLDQAEDSPDMVQWKHEVLQAKHKFDLLCLKNRHGRRFDLPLWAEMSANAIRDREPGTVEEEENAQGLLAGV